MTGNPFVGRAREIRELRGVLTQARPGDGLVLITGEAGVGKTTLCREIEAEALDRSWRTAWGRCRFAGTAYEPWVEVLRALERTNPGDVVDRALALLSGRVSNPTEMRPVDEESERFALLDAVGSALQSASEVQPTLIVLDDLHDADIASLRILEFLTPLLRAGRLLILTTVRDIDARDSPERSAVIDRLARFGQRLYLGNLDEPAIGELLVALAPEAVPTNARRISTAAALHRWTAGSPLFVQEMIRLLRAENRLTALSDQSVAALPLPGSIRDLLLSRLQRLPEDSRTTLTAAAVLGTAFDLATLAQLCELNPSEVLSRLEPALAERVVEPDGASAMRFTFRHELLRAVLYQGLAPAERCSLHNRAVTLLEEPLARNPDPILAEITDHAERALPLGSAQRAIELLLRCGSHALRLHADDEALARFERAATIIRTLPGDHTAFQLEATLGSAEARVRLQGAEAAHATLTYALGLARAAGRGDAVARAVLGLTERGFGAPQQVGDPATVALIEEALGGLPAKAHTLRVALLAKLAAELCFDPQRERASDLAREAIRESRALDDPPTLIHALNVQYFLHWRRAEFGACPVLSSEMFSLAQAIGNRPMELQARVWRIHEAVLHGDISGFESELEAYVPLATRIGQPRHRWQAATYAALRALWLGQWSEVDRHAAEALQHAAGVSDPGVSTIPLVQMTLARRDQGFSDDDLPRLQLAAERFRSSPVPGALFAVALADIGRKQEAIAEYERLANGDFADLQREFRIGVLSFLTELCALAGDARRAAILRDQLLPLRQYVLTMGGAAVVGAVSHHLGVLAATMDDPADAAEHLKNAVASHRAMRCPAWLARSLIESASVQTQRGDRSRALESLEEAASITERFALGGLKARIDSAQAAFRLRVAAASVSLDPERRTVLPFAARTRRSPAAPTVPASDSNKSALLFRREGEYFSLGDEAHPFRLRRSKGLDYIAQLLRHPDTPFHVTEIVAGAPQVDIRATGTSNVAPVLPIELSVRSDLGDAGELLDPLARGDYRRRLSELREQLTAAERWNDRGNCERIRTEMDFLVEELQRAVGRTGRARRGAEHAERARINVTRTIKAALQGIERHDPALARHLGTAIKTGWFCRYVPDPGHAPLWEF